MKGSRKLSGLVQGLLAFFAVYAAITLLPAAVWAWADPDRPQNPSAPSPSPTAAPREAAPGFLDGSSLLRKGAEASQSDPSADVFTLYDQEAEKSVSVTAKELLPAALACEMDLASPEEALKAQAVACYTLFCQKRAAGETIVCSPSQWLTWTSESAMRERWGEDCGDKLALLERVVDSVAGQALVQDEEPILAAYFAISGGATETAGNVWEEDLPYLQAVASPGDRLADGYLSTVSFSWDQFQQAAVDAFGEEGADLSGDPEAWLSDLEYTPSGYLKTALLGGMERTGTELRSAFSLRSACFTAEQTGEGITFTVRGWGHGVGMSQAGAVFLAKQGASYEEILSHFYPGAVLTTLP